MDSISCVVLTNTDERIAHINVYAIPRVGEYLWFSQERAGHTSWRVVEVAHWVGNGDRQEYQEVALYVKPTKEEKENG